MNFQNYRTIYGHFHACRISSSLIRDDIMVIHMNVEDWSNYYVSRAYKASKATLDIHSPFTQALKAHFKMDVPASVFCKDDRWTVFLGNHQVIIPSEEGPLHLYVTPYHVTNPNIISQYMVGKLRPPYDHVYNYKDSILYLDDQDSPYPGGCYFNKGPKSSYYRLCFLTERDATYVSKLLDEWSVRRDILNLPYITQSTIADPKFIPFQPIAKLQCADANTLSTGFIRKKESLRKCPNFILQEILSSYYYNRLRISDFDVTFRNIGLIVEWPLQITYEGAKHAHLSDNKYVALSVNGRSPERIICVQRPYDRYTEYSHVPATIWTPISYVQTVIQVPNDVQKVVVDSTVLGFKYKDAFFCASHPILEGRYCEQWKSLNTDCILTPVANLKDENIQVIESFRHNDHYTLHRVALTLVPFDLWCLGLAEKTHPYPHNVQVPYLVKYWLTLLSESSENNQFDVDLTFVKLTQMLSKHKICFTLKADPEDAFYSISLKEIKITMHPEIVEFINAYRLQEDDVEESSNCVII